MSPDLTDAERELAQQLCVATTATRPDATAAIEKCRIRGISAEQVLEYCRERRVDTRTALVCLGVLQDSSVEAFANERVDPQLVPPAPQAPAGNQLHLRAPKNKGERRLVRDIQAGINARNAAMGQLARANRKIAKAERALRQAGMVTEVTQAGPTSPKDGGS